MVLEVRSLKSRFWQTMVPQETRGEDPFLSLLSFCFFAAIFSFLVSALPSCHSPRASPSTYGLPRTLVFLEQEQTPLQYDLIRTDYMCNNTISNKGQL